MDAGQQLHSYLCCQNAIRYRSSNGQICIVINTRGDGASLLNDYNARIDPVVNNLDSRRAQLRAYSYDFITVGPAERLFLE